MKKLPDLEAWAIFAKVAETGSFARAATELGLSQATVSKAVSRLEQRLHTNLLQRTSRRLSLTASGQAAQERAARLLQEGEAIEADITEQSGSLRGQIRLTAPMSFGVAHLAPALPDFMQAHPGISLDVNFSDEQVDIVAGGYDLALRISTLDDSSLLALRLCTVRILPVGAPDCFARHGQPRHPRDLAGLPALEYAYARTGRAWQFTHPQQGEFSQAMASPLRVNNADALLPALRRGLGLALLPEFLVWEDLQAGTLQTCLPGWQAHPIALYIVTPPGRLRPARVQVLIDFLATRFRQPPWGWPEGSRSQVRDGSTTILP
ncbi:LysR family transcriptional regulator [Alcaligenaceae bacterium SJ-26]|nr:LysR family transcriptional regulator [Alcaligenaceae bacterium SJ-26]